MIEGNLTYLRLMEIEDVKHKVDWINDKEIRSTLIFSDYPTSKVLTEQWLRKVAGDRSRKDLIICLKSDNTPIGFAGIKSIDYQNLKAESYLCIGVKEYWGKGLGLDVKRAILNYCFNELRLNKVYSYHLVDNKPMIRINLKLGGKQEGILREDIYADGKLVDRVVVSILKQDLITSQTETK